LTSILNERKQKIEEVQPKFRNKVCAK